MNDLHNLHNAAEVQRLKDEHPGEDDLIAYNRTKGRLAVTRGMCTRCFFFRININMVLYSPWGCNSQSPY